MTRGTKSSRAWVLALCAWAWLSPAAQALTAEEVIGRVRQQLATSSEVVRGAMQTYVGEQRHRHYAFVLARQWQPETATEAVRIDFDSPVTLPDADSSLRAQNRYLLKRVGQEPPTQWLYLPALRRVRIAPYHPAERLLQSDYWFYDLTAITNLSDYTYQFAEENQDTPVLTGTPQVAFVPYRTVVLHCQRRGDAYLIATLSARTADTTRDAQFLDYREIAPGRFRPQRLVIHDKSGGRTEMTFQQWRLDAASPDLFTGPALETRSLHGSSAVNAP